MSISLLVDIGVVLVLLISAGVSFYRGLIREVLTIVGVLGGAMAALMFGESFKPIVYGWYGLKPGQEKVDKIMDILPMDLAADMTAYALIFLAVFILLQLASHFLSSSAHAIGLGPVDRTLGIFFGIARGVLLLGVLYLPFHLILSDDNKKEWLSHSKTMFYVEGMSGWLADFLPQDDEAKKSAEAARDKLKKIDILGDKKISDEDKGSAAPADDGYSDQDRNGMDDLIDSIKPQQENGPKKGSYNE